MTVYSVHQIILTSGLLIVLNWPCVDRNDSTTHEFNGNRHDTSRPLLLETPSSLWGMCCTRNEPGKSTLFLPYQANPHGQLLIARCPSHSSISKQVAAIVIFFFFWFFFLLFFPSLSLPFSPSSLLCGTSTASHLPHCPRVQICTAGGGAAARTRMASTRPLTEPRPASLNESTNCPTGPSVEIWRTGGYGCDTCRDG